MAANKLLGQFNLVAIRQRPRSVLQIEVSFTLDQNGIFTVQAKDEATEKDQQIRVQPLGGSPEPEIGGDRLAPLR
jgi:molecular chaperone DnaK